MHAHACARACRHLQAGTHALACARTPRYAPPPHAPTHSCKVASGRTGPLPASMLRLGVALPQHALRKIGNTQDCMLRCRTLALAPARTKNNNWSNNLTPGTNQETNMKNALRQVGVGTGCLRPIANFAWHATWCHAQGRRPRTQATSMENVLRQLGRRGRPQQRLCM